ncbi:MAG: hypothetical protein QOI55_2262, partial [Actinomycetota bacterium]|nr:hypothetical protein [Actinomycetota bacterium]
RALIAGTALVVVLAIVLGMAVANERDPAPRRVALFGDSLTQQASKYWMPLMDVSGRWDARQSSLAGTAICDWFKTMEKTRDQFHPQTVAFQFVGNDILPCMRNPDGSQLSKAEYLRRWRRNTRHAIELFDRSVTIDLIGPPAMGTPDNRVYDIFRELARQYPNTRFVDGGRLVTPHRRFVKTLPCLRGEPCTGPIVHGVRTNVVRAWDEVHFCPIKLRHGGPCPLYSSGAYRFALTEFEGITGQPAPSVPPPTSPSPTTTKGN